MMFCCCASKEGESIDLQLNSAFAAEDPVLLGEPEVTPPEVAESSATIGQAPRETASIEDPQQPQQPPEVAPEVEETKIIGSAVKVQNAPMSSSQATLPPHRDFIVKIKKEHKDAPIGLELDTVGASCGMVMQVMEGAVKTYNAKAPAEDRVLPGDFIIGVNGVEGNTKGMAQQAVQDLTLDLLFRRPAEFLIVLDKDRPGGPTSCGMDLEYLGIGRTLLIQDIKDGLVMEWNKAHPTRQVKINDRIVSVNGFVGEAEKMLEMCTKIQKLELKIARPG